jgi:hypothetical protein
LSSPDIPESITTMLSSRPVIFISAVSKELRIARDLVAKTRSAVAHTPKQPDPTFGPVSHIQS